ncbi:MAG: hypothetical protein QG622_2951 [Actinomycetota bacterium]|nr:hypothetical protein [Actinomycetota bacterium]
MSITGIITALVVGLVIGGLARLVLPGKQDIALWLTILVGAVGAFVGTFLARILGVADTNGIDWIELVFQIVVAAAGIAVLSGMSGRKQTRA